jgi:putative transposase
MDLSGAATVVAQSPAAFEHFNEFHSHSGLKMKLPREYRRQLSEQRQGRPLLTSHLV